MNIDIKLVKNLKHAKNAVINTIKNNQNNISVVVPDKLSLSMEKLIMEKLFLSSTMNIEVTTIDRIAKGVLKELNIQPKRINNIGSIILINKALKNTELKCLKSKSYSFNYSNEIFKTISQIKSCNIECEELINFSTKSTNLKNKINDLGEIFKQYSLLKLGYIDANDGLTLSAINIANSEVVKNTEYVFVGFTDFTAQGYQMIEMLVKYSKNVTVLAYYNTDGNNRSIYNYDTVIRLKKIAETLQCPYKITNEDYFDDEVYIHLANNLFALSNNQVNLSQNVFKIYSAESIKAEIENVARIIRKGILQGASFKDFGVAVYDLESNAKLIKSIFNKYELNAYIDLATNLSSNIYFKFILSFLEVFSSRHSKQSIINFVSMPFVNFSDKEKSALFNVMNKFNYTNIKADLFRDTIGEEIYDLLEKFRVFPTDRTETIIEKTNNFLEYIKIDNLLDNLIEKVEDPLDKKMLEQAKDKTNEIFNSLKEFFVDANLDEFVEIFKSSATMQQIPPLPLSIDAIQIFDANEILESYNHLFVLNCNKHNAPLVMQDCGIILDNEIKNLSFKQELEPSIRHLNKMAKLKLFNNLSTFNKTLTISMNVSDVSEISDVVFELKNKFKINYKEIKIESVKQNSYEILSKWDFIEYVSKNNLYDLELFKDFCKEFAIKNEEIKSSLNKRSVELINERTEISASLLESFYRCPLGCLLDNFLQLEDEVTSDIKSNEIGTILHNLAHKYYLQKDREKLDAYGFSSETILDEIRKDEKLKFRCEDTILKLLMQEGARFIEGLRLLDENSLFKTSANLLEKAFGEGKQFKSLKLNDKTLKGFIDRIDVCGDYFRIIDYKSGKVKTSLKALYFGEKLQLFLYAKAAEENLNKKCVGVFYMPIKNEFKQNSEINSYKLTGYFINDTQTVHSLDSSLSKDNKVSNIVDLTVTNDLIASTKSYKPSTSTEFSSMINYSYSLALEAEKNIFSGNLKPSPLNIEGDSACTYCKYLAMCKKNCLGVEERKDFKIEKENLKGENNG